MLLHVAKMAECIMLSSISFHISQQCVIIDNNAPVLHESSLKKSQKYLCYIALKSDFTTRGRQDR